MKNVLLAIFRAVIVLPFTAGTRGGHSGPFRLYDCSTSSVVMLSGLLAVIVVLTGSLAISKDLISRLTAIIAILIIIVIAGIVSCMVISYTLHSRHGLLSIASTGRPPRIKSKNLQLLFLWLFVSLASIHFSLSIVVEIDCYDLLSTVKITENALLVVFMIGETALISVLTSYRIHPLPLIRYSMRFLIAVNLSMWFNAIISENTGVHPKPYLNSSDIIPAYINCVRNSTSGKVFRKSWRFLSPAFVEFSLLAVTLLAEIISVNFPNIINYDHERDQSKNDQRTNEDKNELKNQEINDEKEKEGEEDKHRKVNEKEEVIGEETPLLPTRNQNDSTPNQQHTSQLYSSVGIEDRLNSNTNIVIDDSLVVSYRVTSGSSFSFYLIIGLSVFLCLPHFVGYLLQATVLTHNETLTLLLGWYEAAIKLFMILAVLLGFYFTENVMSPPTVSRTEPFKTKDWIFLVSVFCMFVSHCFEMLAGYMSENRSADAILVCNCLSFAQDYLQTVFLLHVVKCQRKVSYAKCAGIASLCLFMTITNFGCWAIDGFIIAHSLQQTRMETMKILSPTVWMTLYSFFLPLTLYYRFASAFAFHELYKTFIPK